MMYSDWKIQVVFSGLILFVTDPDSADKIIQALLLDGRLSHHASDLSHDDTDCSQLVQSDFEHHPLLFWEVAQAGDPTWEVGGQALKHEIQISFKEPPATGGADAAKGERWSWLPEWTRCMNMNPQPDMDDAQEPFGFGWVPNLQCLGKGRSLHGGYYRGDGRAGDGVFVNMAIRGGTIRNGGFAWVQDSHGDFWIPRLRFRPNQRGNVAMRKAGAEVVVWDLEVPNDVQELTIMVSLDGTGQPQPLRTFSRSKGPVVIHLTNNPAQRCHGRVHPGRRLNSESPHFAMLYPMTGPLQEPIPQVPEKLHGRWWHTVMRNAVPHVEMRGYGSSPGGEWAPPAGSINRPLCVPGGDG